MKRFSLIIALIVVLAVLTACSAKFDNPNSIYPSVDGYYTESVTTQDTPNYNYDEITENGFVSANEQNTSYFSLDRSTASYSVMRRQINAGMSIAKGSVRLEEYINYFNYNYLRPQQGEDLAIGGNLFDCPWNSQHKLLSVEVAAEEISFDASKQNNVVFLVDTSGSMYGNDRLGLIQQSFTMVLENLNDNDIVSIVTYAGDSRVALDGARGYEKTKIANVLQDLEASGSTNGSGGITTAYQLAEKYFVEGGNNRVILATDGDFNVGISNKDELKNFIAEKSNKGVYLSVFGVGMFNLNDSNLKTLAENGNGNYVYLDSIAEARKCLVKEFNGTFNVVAKDAKIGVKFNNDVVESFRLLGYESRMMSEDEFNDEKKDAGEIGSGHTVTALYELVLKDGASGNIAAAEVRYKSANETSKSVNKTFTTDDYVVTPNEDNVFIGCVAEFALILRQSEYKGDASYNAVIARLQSLESVVGEGADPFRAEFLQLVQKASTLE